MVLFVQSVSLNSWRHKVVGSIKKTIGSDTNTNVANGSEWQGRNEKYSTDVIVFTRECLAAPPSTCATARCCRPVRARAKRIAVPSRVKIKKSPPETDGDLYKVNLMFYLVTDVNGTITTNIHRRNV